MVWVRKLQLITGNVVKENEMKGFTDYTDISHIGSSHMDDYGRDSANVNLITEQDFHDYYKGLMPKRTIL